MHLKPMDEKFKQMEGLSLLLDHLEEEHEHVAGRFRLISESITGIRALKVLLQDNRSWFTKPLNDNGSRGRSIVHLNEDEKVEHAKLLAKATDGRSHITEKRRRILAANLVKARAVLKKKGPSSTVWTGMTKEERTKHARWLASHRVYGKKNDRKTRKVAEAPKART